VPLKNKVVFCSLLALFIVVNSWDISNATFISITNQYQNVYSESKVSGSITNTKEITLTGNGTGRSTINAYSHAESYDPYNDFRSFSSGTSSQTANTHFSNDSTFEASLSSAVFSSQHSLMRPVYNRLYSEYSLEFNINTASNINFSEYFTNDMYYADVTFTLFDKSRELYIVNNPYCYPPYLPYLDDVNMLHPQYSLLAGDYELYLLLYTGNVGSDEGLNCQADINLQFSVNAIPTPEPSTFLLFGGGLAGLVFWRKKSVK